MSRKISVLGAGAWGTALAENFSRSGHEVTLWGRNAEQLSQTAQYAENKNYLPGIKLSSDLQYETDLVKAAANADIILLVVPAQHLRSIARTINPYVKSNAVLVSCAKGIEQDTGSTMSQLLGDECAGKTIAALSGPSFAVDVARGLPTAVTVAAGTMQSSLALCETLSNKRLRCYASDDLIGVDYGGALKNVLAIAAGIVHGRNLGASALAAITARGFAELQSLALALNARPETLTGLSGLGDLILTCASEKSRNFAYGAAVGRGEGARDMKLAEGVATAKIAAEIAAQNKVEAPLISAVSAVLAGELDIDQAIERLMNRPIKSETGLI